MLQKAGLACIQSMIINQIQGQCFSPVYSRFESSGKSLVVRMETLTYDRMKTYVAPEKKMTVTSVIQHLTDQDV